MHEARSAECTEALLPRMPEQGSVVWTSGKCRFLAGPRYGRDTSCRFVIAADLTRFERPGWVLALNVWVVYGR